MSQGPQLQAAMGWYIHAEDRVWGPYAEPRLSLFVAEGRVSRATMIGQSEQGPFIPAGLQDDLVFIFAGDDLVGPQIDMAQSHASPRSGVSPSLTPMAQASTSNIDSGRSRGRSLAPGPLDMSLAVGDGLSTASNPVSMTDPTPVTGASRPLLVFANLQSFATLAFETVLAQHGPFERVADGLWLIRARLGPAALRNALSRRLRKDDALLVVEADLEKAAWFNLDLAEERRVRALWAR